jgi:acetyl esterase/lipase
MHATAVPPKPTGLALVFDWPRIRFVLIAGSIFGLMVGSGWKSGFFSGYSRVLALAFVAMMAFGLFEHWPRRLPRFLARWVLQVIGVAISIPIATFLIYKTSTPPGDPPFFFIHGARDSLVDPQDNRDIDARLRSVGVPSSFQLVTNGVHGWDSEPAGPISPSWAQILQMELAFFDTYLK